MAYELKFLDLAFEEWQNLDPGISARLRRKLERRLEQPRIESQRLRGALAHCFKIRDDKSGFRLIYLVDDDYMLLRVIAVGKREDFLAYRIAEARLD